MSPTLSSMVVHCELQGQPNSLVIGNTYKTTDLMATGVPSFSVSSGSTSPSVMANASKLVENGFRFECRKSSSCSHFILVDNFKGSPAGLMYFLRLMVVVGMGSSSLSSAPGGMTSVTSSGNLSTLPQAHCRATLVLVFLADQSA